MHKFSKSEAIIFGWTEAKKRIGFFLGVLAIIILIFAGFNLIAGVLAFVLEDGFLAVLMGIIIYIVNSWVLPQILNMGYIKIGLKICDGEKPKMEDLLNCYPLFFRFIAATALYGTLVALGLISFVVPGVILAVKFGYYAYFIVDKNQGVIESLKSSSRITMGSKWNLFLFWMLLCVINILGLLCFVVGLIITLPLSLIAISYVYRRLLEHGDVDTVFGQVDKQTEMINKGS